MYNFTLFRPHLYIYDDHIVYKKRHILTHDEFSFTYNHIAQVNLVRFIYLFAHLEIATTGMRSVNVKWVFKGKAVSAKKLIDQKIHQVHKKHKYGEARKDRKVTGMEKSLKRLKELLNSGKISKREFNSRKKHLLKKHF